LSDMPPIVSESMAIWIIVLGSYLAALTVFLYWWARLPQ
jgi:hypothetical protein